VQPILNLLATFLLSAATLLAGPSEVQTRARYLAGLAPTGLGDLNQEAAFKDHAQAMREAWHKLRARRLEPMDRFSKQELGDLRQEPFLFYPFGGPDLLHARALFPEAKVYVLCGLEPVGALPDPRALGPEARAQALAQMRRALATSLRLSFFVTRDMSRDLRGKAWAGVVPILAADAALLGDELRCADYLALDPQGRPVPEAQHPTGVRLRFNRPGSSEERTVYYWRQDCSDQAFRNGDHPFLAYLRQQGPCATYVKSASYLLHMKTFSLMREHILKQSKGVLQDDSGLPNHCFLERKWSAQPYGAYEKPIRDFKWGAQKDLEALFQDKTKVKPLGFFTGYGRKSHLVCYRAPR